MNSIAKLGIILLCVLVAVALPTATVYGQCGPPGMNVRCWDAGGNGVSWNDAANWNPTGTPASSDDVFHLIGGEITLNIGTPASPIPVHSLTILGDGNGALAIEAGKGLSIAGDFTTTELSTGDFFGLSVGSEARLDVGGTLGFATVTVSEGADYDHRTVVAVTDTAGPSDWTVEPFTQVFLSDGFDGSGYSSNLWSIWGQVTTWGSIVGAGQWFVEPTGDEVGEDIFLWFNNASSGDFIDLEVNDWGEVYFAPLYASGPTFRIRNSLYMEGGWVFTNETPLIADEGSLITLGGAAILTVGYGFSWTWKPSEIGRVDYITDLPTVFNCRGGLLLRDVDSAIRKGGESATMTLDLYGDLSILSQIHDEAASWDTTGVDMVFRVDDLYPELKLEVTSPDYDGIWFEDSPCIKPWANIEIPCVGSEYCTINIVDDEQNSNADIVALTDNGEAMYVNGDVVLDENLDTVAPFKIIYYNGSASGMEEIPSPFRYITKTLYGDWNNDCTLTPGEYIALLRVINHTDDFENALMDFNCDGQVTSSIEGARFQFNVNDNCDQWIEVCGGCGALSCCDSLLGGGMGNGTEASLCPEDLSLLATAVGQSQDPGTMATWIGQSLTSSALADAISTLQAIAAEEGETQLGADATWLANYLGS